MSATKETVDPQSTRDDIRAKVFAAEAVKSEVVNVYGTQIELRPPSLGSLLDVQDMSDTKRSVAMMIIEYSYVPGTNIQVFETADIDSLLELRFGDDLRKMQGVITRMTGVDMNQAQKEVQSPLDETS